MRSRTTARVLMGVVAVLVMAIRQTEELAAGFKFVATGHGPVGTVKDVTAWRVYLEALRDAVAAGLAAGQTLEQMQQNIKMAEYSHRDGFDCGRRLCSLVPSSITRASCTPSRWDPDTLHAETVVHLLGLGSENHETSSLGRIGHVQGRHGIPS